MKFFHLSDLHIGLKLINRDLREDQEYIFHQIAELAIRERPDALVIAGDIYDKAVPSAEAMEVLDGFIEELTQNLPELVIMMISGNHDSAVRVNCYRSVLARQRLHMIGLPPVQPEEYIEKVVLRDAYGSVNFYLLPFVKPSMVKLITGTDEKGNNLSYDETLRRMLAREEINMAERNVLVSHQFYLPAGKEAEEVERMDSEIRTVGNIDEVSAEILHLFDYAALGHIHKPMKLGSECIRYCGTMLACSVSEAGQQKGVIEVELGEKGEVQTRILPLHPLRQIKVLRGTAEEILAQACEDYVSVTLTDTPDFDTQNRLRAAFPYLLEIRRDTLLQRTMQEHCGLRKNWIRMKYAVRFWGMLRMKKEPYCRKLSILYSRKERQNETIKINDAGIWFLCHSSCRIRQNFPETKKRRTKKL